MWQGAGSRRRAATAATALALAGWLAAAGPAVADAPASSPPTTPTTIGTSSTVPTTSTTVAVATSTVVTTVPQNQTKIIQTTPAPTAPDSPPAPAAPAASPAPVPAAASPSPSAAPETAASVSADSPALDALLAVTSADQRKAAGDVARTQSDLTTLRAAFDAAQADLSARQADEAAARSRLDAAQADLTAAESRLSAAGLAASSAAVAVAVAHTPVASPPSPGHSPRDAAVQASHELAAATADRDARRATVADRQRDLDTAQQASAAAGAAFTARADDLQQGLDALDQARQQLTGSGTVTDAAGTVELRPAPTALASVTIPADYLALYGRAAATCPGLSWLVLAGIGSVESGHGQSDAPGVHSGANFAGAMGPMQFLAGTWASYGVDGDGDGVRDVYNPADAIFGAANYLCASGGADVSTLRRALWDYNHADWYVEEVLQIAARY